MSLQEDHLRDVLKKHGLSFTKGRQLVFAILHSHPPLTTSEIFELADHRLDRASLYRIVRVFEEIGVVHRIPVGWKHKFELSDLFSAHHHHFRCLECHRLRVIPEDTVLESRIEAVAAQIGVQLTAHQVELQGYCAKCRNGQS